MSENRNPDVDVFLAELDHPLKTTVERLRLAILGCDPDITEHIKWNAPSFRFNDIDRVTFNLRPRDQVQLIFHRGAHINDSDFPFDITRWSGLLEMISHDRGQVKLANPEVAAARQNDLVQLVREWIQS